MSLAPEKLGAAERVAVALADGGGWGTYVT